MVHYKAALTMTVGILSILSSIFIIIIQGFSEAFCKMTESCIYTPTLPLFPVILVLVGGLLTMIGLVCGGAKDDALVSDPEVRDSKQGSRK